MQAQKTVFVIMPFSKTESYTVEQWTEIYTDVFEPAILACGYSCERANPVVGDLMKSIVSKLRHSNIVLADVTDRNANVFYELGVRHSLSKRTIIITQQDDHVPSDLKGSWFLRYGISPAQVNRFKREIHRLIKEIETDPEKIDNPVLDFLEDEHANVSSFIDTQNVKKLSALYTEFTGNVVVLEQLQKSPESKVFIYTDALKLLLQTMYVDPGSNYLKRLYEVHNALRYIESGINYHHLIRTTLQELKDLALYILDIRNKVASKEYNEPTTISLMAWKPSAGRAKGSDGRNRCANAFSTEILDNALAAKVLKCHACESVLMIKDADDTIICSCGEQINVKK
jgi:hypothetical protein